MNLFYRLYQFCIAAPLIILATILTAVITILGSAIAGAHFWGYWPAHYWSKFICRILFLRVEIRGMEHIDPHTSYVLVANHQGAFDIFLIYGYLGRNFKWMMKKELRQAPFIGKACESARHIFVDNSTPRKVIETMRQASATLQGGTSLVVFPEGRRTFNGRMNPFKKGAYQLAIRLQLPIVPMTINGSFDILPRTRGINFVQRRTLSLTIHQPIVPQGKSDEVALEIMQKSRAAINEALDIKYQD